MRRPSGLGGSFSGPLPLLLGFSFMFFFALAERGTCPAALGSRGVDGRGLSGHLGGHCDVIRAF